MGTTGKTWTRATATCPRPEHAGSHVRFDGQYGKPDHRRQRYRQAALVARERARRLRTDPDTGELRSTRHGQLVMD